MPNKIIPVFSPKLPTAEQVLPYLQKIDLKRWYTNFGPLHFEFIRRLAELFAVESDNIVCGNTGTTLLELCLRAFEIEAGSLCIMPSWTFVATPLAALSAHLTPCFVDVNLTSQAVDPEQLLEDLPLIKKIGKVGAVVVTAPFGRPVNTHAWMHFREKTGIPVLIDAAAAFDSVLQNLEMKIGPIPMMMSLHATKILGIGEGGMLVSSDIELVKKICSMTQYGFANGERRSYCAGTNAKLSEYASAVGLAALDNWQDVRASWRAISDYYMHAFKKNNIQNLLSKDWLSTTCNIIVPHEADLLISFLEKNNISSRKWWDEGCHLQPAFRLLPRLSTLENTKYLAKSLFGLPYSVDLVKTLIDKIVNCVQSRSAVCV